MRALVLDPNAFSRGLICDIMRGLDVVNVVPVRSEEEALERLGRAPFDVMLIAGEEGDTLNALEFTYRLRRSRDETLRRLPVILVKSGLNRQHLVDGRDSGVDEFLSKPISPAAMRQRLGMVIETPRPFVDCRVYVGPCRRRKNPADYYGAKRRAGDRPAETSTNLVDQEQIAAASPIRVALAELRQACSQFDLAQPETLGPIAACFGKAQAIARQEKDEALQGSLAAFEAYVSVTARTGAIDSNVLSSALTAMEQLSMLPPEYKEARDSVAIMLGKAIHKKLAA